jgi:DeoR/GlpR family transcriptional regulator of sugar metabolism
MLTDERHTFIRRELAAKGRILAGDLAARFGVSDDTARRDLRDLAKMGECRRVYGGAVTPAPRAEPIGIRLKLASDEKLRLATAASRLVKDGQSLFIDGGSTNTIMAGLLPVNTTLTVATNSLGVASALAGHQSIRLIILGGVHNPALGTCVGGQTLRAISEFNADMFFLGSCGIDAKHGATAFDDAEAEVKRAMAGNSSSIVVIATSDKLATAAPFHVARPETIRHLVVDRDAPVEKCAQFERNGTIVHTA